MLNKEQLNNRYNKFFGLGDQEDLSVDHLNPEYLDNSRLLAELDDLIEVISQTSNTEYVQLKQTKPGKALSKVVREIRNRLQNHTNIVAALAPAYGKDLKDIARLKETDPEKAHELTDAIAGDLADETGANPHMIADMIFADPSIETVSKILKESI